MVDFSAGYQPPGVYVDTVSTGSVAAVGVGVTTLCLIGKGLGYETATENVSFAQSTTAVLAKKGVVNDASLVVSAVLDDGLHVFTPDAGQTQHDYSITTTTGVTTITRHTSGQVPVDKVVKIVYRYSDDDYYALNKFDDFPTLVGVYGQPLDTVGNISSEISFAAQVAMRNNANVVYCIALDLRSAVIPESPTETEVTAAWNAAYAKATANYDINILVPLWSDVDDSSSATSRISDLSSALASAESDSNPMIGIIGVSQSYSTNDPDTLAASATDRRIVLAWPQKLYYFNSQKNKGSTICDGIYLAAACAGTLADQDLNRGLTRSQISGFTGIPADVLAVMTPSKKNGWSSKGVSVLEVGRSNQLVIRQGVTTDVSDIGNREISVVRCQDAILESIQLTLDNADLIGDPITVNTPLMVSALIDGALQSLLSDDVLASYTSPTVTQAPGPDNNPTVIQVTFSYKPIYPLNYITVSFVLDLTTNTITNATDVIDTTAATV